MDAAGIRGRTLALGAAGCAAAAVAAGALATGWDSAASAPTAHAIESGLNILLGVAGGLFLGSVVTGAIATRGRFLTAAAAATTAYALVLTPIWVLTSPDGVDLRDSVVSAAFVFLPMAAVIMFGAAFGALAGRVVDAGRARRKRSLPP